jgi:hypothetical protein
MDEQRFDPAQEKDALSAAIGAVHRHWGTAQMGQASEALVQAIAHAEPGLSNLEPQSAFQDMALRSHVLGLRWMTLVALRRSREWNALRWRWWKKSAPSLPTCTEARQCGRGGASSPPSISPPPYVCGCRHEGFH